MNISSYLIEVYWSERHRRFFKMKGILPTQRLKDAWHEHDQIYEAPFCRQQLYLHLLVVSKGIL